MVYKRTRGHGGQPFQGSKSSKEEEVIGDRRDTSEENVRRILSEFSKGHNQVVQ